MAEESASITSAGIQGWRQFQSSKLNMLNSYDRARIQAEIHEIETSQGIVAEAEARKWLEDFLPKRYGVTPGYIISQGQRDYVKAPHFDVILYDALDSPVLWIEESPDLTPAGRSRAIPAEYVKAVIEVKSSASTKSINKALEHLADLNPLLEGADAPEERYKKYLPPGFFAGVLFFEIRTEEHSNLKALNAFSTAPIKRGFFGAVILRGEGMQPQVSGRIFQAISDDPIESSLHSPGASLLSGFAFSDFVPNAAHRHIGAILRWTVNEFPTFAFDLLAALSGTYDIKRLSSFHGQSWPSSLEGPSLG